jgi:hypothetical protein
MPKVYKSQLIEVIQPANSTATKLQFQDFPYLRGREIYGIETYNSIDMSISPTQKALPTVYQSQLAYLTLYLDDRAQGAKNVGEWIQNVPFSSMHRTQTQIYTTTTTPPTTSSNGNMVTPPFVRQMFEMTGQIVYWEKCYFSFGSSLGNTSDVSFCLNVYFK